VIESDDRPVRVYKVGGSLFDWPELFDRLPRFLGEEGGRALLVAGGGAAADVVREWDRVHALGEERAHRLAIKSLCLGEAFLADGLPGAAAVCDRDEAVRAWREGRTPILCVDRFLASEETGGREPLPHRWDVTSDSIAAWVAVRWPAELTLLKSTSADAGGPSFVDPYFPTVAAEVRRKGWVNLRSGERGTFGAG